MEPASFVFIAVVVAKQQLAADMFSWRTDQLNLAFYQVCLELVEINVQRSVEPGNTVLK